MEEGTHNRCVTVSNDAIGAHVEIKATPPDDLVEDLTADPVIRLFVRKFFTGYRQTDVNGAGDAGLAYSLFDPHPKAPTFCSLDSVTPHISFAKFSLGHRDRPPTATTTLLGLTFQTRLTSRIAVILTACNDTPDWSYGVDMTEQFGCHRCRTPAEGGVIVCRQPDLRRSAEHSARGPRQQIVDGMKLHWAKDIAAVLNSGEHPPDRQRPLCVDRHTLEAELPWRHCR